jgi:hypothetical protein
VQQAELGVLVGRVEEQVGGRAAGGLDHVELDAHGPRAGAGAGLQLAEQAGGVELVGVVGVELPGASTGRSTR